VCSYYVGYLVQVIHHTLKFKYRVILKSLRDFRPLRYSSRDGHAEGNMSTEGETLQISIVPYRYSICPPLVTRHLSILLSSSDHTRCNIWRPIAATASRILFCSFATKKDPSHYRNPCWFKFFIFTLSFFKVFSLFL
jgi:hypothetical protein